MATLTIELFVCERYRPLAGWSQSYLLPTDRNAYRIRGHKSTWRTIEEVEAALISPGWTWEETEATCPVSSPNWEVNAAGQQTDAEGWSYASNFTSSYEGSPKASLQKFVRWRRLVRVQSFAGGSDALLAHVVAQRSSNTSAPATLLAPAPPPCPHVDLDCASRVGRSLLEALAMASLHGDWSDYAVAQLKAQLLDRLAGKPGKEKDSLADCLSSFMNAGKGIATRVSEAFKSSDSAALVARLQVFETKCPPSELEAYSVLAIRRFEPDMACGEKEEHECKFQPVLCPHEGCQERCSSKDLEVHDQNCPRKPMACEKCGEMIPRCEHRVHALAACPKREATCTFSCIGCQVPVQHCDLEKHLDESTQGHLMLLMRSVVEQQDLVRVLTARVKDLETSCAQAVAAREAEKEANAALVTKLAGMEAKFAALEQKSAQDLKKSCDAVSDGAKKKAEAVEKEAKRRLDDAEKAHKADLGTVRADITSIKTSVSELGKLRADVDHLKGSLEQVRGTFAAAAEKSTATAKASAHAGA
mmetsp:Transcript_117735/g.305549  ORF Transcript_117735/g.305549 Transcript_117735/m.305549 type:complete len:531 (-) Transcript_117735:106-1698(-)